MKEELHQLVSNALKTSHFDSVAVGIVDFEKKSFESEFFTRCEFQREMSEHYFDLASLTKPLTLALSYLIDPKVFTEEMILLLEHRAGLPAWGRLSHHSWKEQVLSYEIVESDVLYSDFSALRLQLEIEKVVGMPIYQYVSSHFDNELKNWLDLTTENCIVTGMRNKKSICGEVHDDNAFVINERVSHAGLFGTIDGVCRTLLNIDQNFNLLKTIKPRKSLRFEKGFDTVSNPENSLAGPISNTQTFGHLGFTGTSFWVYPHLSKALVILSNETHLCWYSRKILNTFRKDLASYI